MKNDSLQRMEIPVDSCSDILFYYPDSRSKTEGDINGE